MRATLPLLLIALAAVGCRTSKPQASEPVVAAPITQPAPPSTPVMPKDDVHAGVIAAPTSKAPVKAAAAPAAPAQGEGLTGKVLERIDASPYCYLRLKTAKGEVWAAIPEAKIEKGAEVTIANPMMMGHFESKTLKRTFEEIYFGTLAPVGTAAAPASNPHSKSTPAEAVEVGKVQKAAGAEARTVAEVWGLKGSLKEKTVTVRGKIVKYSEGVMGKNWIHLQDGSGNAKKGTHDLTVTTLDVAAKGEVVTVTGVVRINKDFGSGYAYEVIIEDAAVVKK